MSKLDGVSGSSKSPLDLQAMRKERSDRKQPAAPRRRILTDAINAATGATVGKRAVPVAQPRGKKRGKLTMVEIESLPIYTRKKSSSMCSRCVCRRCVHVHAVRVHACGACVCACGACACVRCVCVCLRCVCLLAVHACVQVALQIYESLNCAPSFCKRKAVRSPDIHANSYAFVCVVFTFRLISPWRQRRKRRRRRRRRRPRP